ncbi:ISL3 family transposase [Bradyrhizobium sp. LM2.3]
MQRALRPSALIPPGFDVESAVCDGATTVITVRPTSDKSLCPGCGASSGRIHSRYQRRLTDLPLAGRSVRLVVVARRFRCVTVMCGDVFSPSVSITALWRRGRGERPGSIWSSITLGLPWVAARRRVLPCRLMLPVSNDTLLRVVRRRGCPPFAAPSVIGIDDWAWRRNQRYGTIICDLERRRPITLLPDREPATAQAWLAGQPQIAVVARDRGGSYALAATKALPQATQVADRWHLMENASQAFLDAVRKSMRQV